MYKEGLTVLPIKAAPTCSNFSSDLKTPSPKSSKLHRSQEQLRIRCPNQFFALLIHWFNIENNFKLDTVIIIQHHCVPEQKNK